jgi:Cdc6-like AAA superfamily ATPase
MKSKKLSIRNLDSFSKRIPLNYQEDEIADGDNTNPLKTFYRSVDSDEFPIGNYVNWLTGKSIKNYFKPSSSGNREICNNPTDSEEIISKYGFQKIYAYEQWNDTDKALQSTRVFQKVEHTDETITGVTLLIVSGVPLPIPSFLKKKIKTNKSSVYISLVSNGSESFYEEVRNDIISRYKKEIVPQNNVHLVVTAHGGYDIESFDLPKQRIDIEMNYGKEFVQVHQTILGALNKQKGKGLVLLHGDPGTGKTHYLKYLASKVRDKRVLFIPPFLADFITSPDMVPFLIQNSNSILFIEDAERVITDRNENGSNGVSNILNITDGILSDVLNIQVVATFNMDKKRIDSALLRKGRLIAEHKFKALTIDETNRLLKHLGSDYVSEKAMTLTEIYNHKDKHYVSEDQTKRPIGFGVR